MKNRLKKESIITNQDSSKMMTGKKRCINCALPEGYPEITIDEKGLCTHCRNYKPKQVLGENLLWTIIKKNRGKKYDVLVPTSGGRDGMFVLYKAVEKFGNRVLALQFHNGFRLDHAHKNFLEAVNRLGIDYKVVRSKYSFPEKIVHHCVKSALPFSLLDITTNCCVACTYGCRAASYREAVLQEIPNILWGDSEEESMSFSYRQNRSKYFFSRRFYNYVMFILYNALFQLEFRIPRSGLFHFNAPAYNGKDVVLQHFYDFVAWDRREIKETITMNLGWSAPPGSVCSWRFDCKIHNLVNYCFKKTFGFTKNFDGFANMIRAGKMEIEEALIEENALGLMDKKLISILKEDMKLSSRELLRYFGIGGSA